MDELSAQIRNCMYQYSRAIYRSIKDLIDPYADPDAQLEYRRAVLEACPEALSVSRLPRIVWSDLGSPHRVMEALTRMRIRPEWARSLAPTA